MYLKNSNFAIYLGLAALVGFGVSFLFGANNVQSDLLSGDISKASRYNNQRVDPETSVIEEKLQNDKEFFEQTKAAMDYLKERTEALSVLTDETVRICADIPELQGSMAGISSLSAKAYNTNLAFKQASAGLARIASGNKAPEYEQASNDALAGFRKIENQLHVSKDFVEAASSYVENNENSELAGIVAVWSAYCAQEAVMNEAKEDLAYWGEKCSEISAAMMGNEAIKTAGSVFFGNSTIRQMVGSPVLGNVNFKNVVNGQDTFRQLAAISVKTATGVPALGFSNIQKIIPGADVLCQQAVKLGGSVAVLGNAGVLNIAMGGASAVLGNNVAVQAAGGHGTKVL